MPTVDPNKMIDQYIRAFERANGFRPYSVTWDGRSFRIVAMRDWADFPSIVTPDEFNRRIGSLSTRPARKKVERR